MRKTICTALVLFTSAIAFAQTETLQFVSNDTPVELVLARKEPVTFNIDKVRGLAVSVVQSNNGNPNTVNISGRLGSGSSRRSYSAQLSQDELENFRQVIDSLIVDTDKRSTDDPKVCCFSAQSGFTVITGYENQFLSDNVNCFLTLQLQSGEMRSKAYLGKTDLPKLKKVLSDADAKLKGL